jgi:phosphohistidine swiveling domain-containing protein
MQNNKWHYLGRWIEPVLSTGLWLEWRHLLKILGIDFKGGIMILDAYQYILQEDVDKAGKFLENKIRNDFEWFDKFFNLCDQKIEKVLSFKNKNDLSGLLKASIDALGLITILIMFDVGYQKYVNKLSKEKIFNYDEFLSLIKPHKNTLLMQYIQDLKKIDKNSENDIKNILDKYGWVGKHVFLGDGLTRERLKEELAEISKTKNIVKNQKPPKGLEKIWELGCKFAFYRSFIVENTNSIIFEYCPTVKELGKKYNLTWDEILLFDYQEVINLNDKGILPKNFKERVNGFGKIIENREGRIITGNQLKEYLNKFIQKVDNDIVEFKGTVASKGGIVKGIARVVEESKYISKMNKGEILVANETTPDYVVGMKIAGAIITNQGGITSHAAITSREMGIPCIIGTKIATKVLKDGDLVEVDAERGIVKIIKKARP